MSKIKLNKVINSLRILKSKFEKGLWTKRKFTGNEKGLFGLREN